MSHGISPINNEGTSPIQKASTNQPSHRASETLSQETIAFIKDNFGFKDVKIMEYTPGTKTIEGMKVLEQIDQAQSSKLLAEIANLAKPGTTLESVIVLIGGHEFIQLKLKELEKDLKKIDKKKVTNLLKSLGLATENDVLFFSTETNIFPGGLLIIKSGLKDIEETL